MKEEALARIEKIIDEDAEELSDELDREIAEHDTTMARLRDVSRRLEAHEETISRIKEILDAEEFRVHSAAEATGKIRGLLHG